MKPVERCPHCLAKIVRYKFSLNKGLVACLFKLYKHGSLARVSDLGLTNSQYVNFQKLAWWRLVRKIEEDGVVRKRGGIWALTELGQRFLEGKEAIHKFVWTYRGDPIDFEGELITVDNVEDGYKYKLEYVEEAVPHF